MKTFYLPSVISIFESGICKKITVLLGTSGGSKPDDFSKPPNRLEMIGDLKATLLLNRLLDPKSDLFKLVVISKVEEVMTQLLIETRSGDPLILINSP